MDEKVTKERSTLYPLFTLNDCIEFIGMIKRVGGKKCSLSTLAQEVGVSVTTNSFKQKISTSKQFGMISVSGGTVELTDKGKRLLYPLDERELYTCKKECFMQAPLYQKLINRFDNQALPTAVSLSNLLLLEYGITSAGKDVAAKNFLESAEQVGVAVNGILIMKEEENPGNIALNDDITYIESTTSCDKLNFQDKRDEEKENEISNYVFSIPILTGGSAKVVIPNTVRKKDLDFIGMYITNMLPVFLENLREELEK